MRTLTTAQVAGELGRTTHWLYGNWGKLVQARILPRPIIGSGPLRWNAAQVYACLDKGLTREQRLFAAAYRAARDAAEASIAGAQEADQNSTARMRLMKKFTGGDDLPSAAGDAPVGSTP